MELACILSRIDLRFGRDGPKRGQSVRPLFLAPCQLLESTMRLMFSLSDAHPFQNKSSARRKLDFGVSNHGSSNEDYERPVCRLF